MMRRLLMMELSCAFSRAFTKLGIAIAASNPMMATTIIISTSVKPALRFVLTCMLLTFLFVRTRGVNNAEGGFIISANFVHKLPSATARYGGLAGLVPRSITIKTQRLVQD